ncbi:hypothetical protein MIS46_07265 [Wielerella bovis]|uniref:hypothetical protein n=1 Tax=Wielerella bovis TaxID=2917790 RepID=UPI002019546D|nr:hypothetical protein [Wielerella bovis]ULJ61800.1 hypothetical protein MIS46_07265 [Wielerella bovis]
MKKLAYLIGITTLSACAPAPYSPYLPQAQYAPQSAYMQAGVYPNHSVQYYPPQYVAPQSVVYMQPENHYANQSPTGYAVPNYPQYVAPQVMQTYAPPVHYASVPQAYEQYPQYAAPQIIGQPVYEPVSGYASVPQYAPQNMQPVHYAQITHQQTTYPTYAQTQPVYRQPENPMPQQTAQIMDTQPQTTPTTTKKRPVQFAKNTTSQSASSNKSIVPSGQNYDQLIARAEQYSSGLTRSVLREAREMTFRKEIVKGGCWDYLDKAWTRAGVGRGDRKVVFSSKKGGAYASPDQLRAGDWLYHINYSYKNIEHSGMFIGWIDKSQNIGLTLSYAGEGRNEPARYKPYDLSGVYQIMRAE